MFVFESFIFEMFYIGFSIGCAMFPYGLIREYIKTSPCVVFDDTRGVGVKSIISKGAL